MLQRLKNYFHLTNSEFRASLVMTALIFALALGLPYAHLLVREDPDVNARLTRWADSLFEAGYFQVDSLVAGTAVDGSYSSTTSFEPDPFHFDPNDLDKDGWKRTGLEDRVIRTILNYREKGGRFRVPDDLNKIYGLGEQDFRRLKPWLVFKDHSKSDGDNQTKVHPKTNAGSEAKEDTALIIELNSADTLLLMKCKGIGKVFASRIIKYRDLLGGFYSKEQLREVWGMDSVKYRLIEGQLHADPSGVKKMDINTISFRELLRHPYFEYHLVKAVFDLREDQGSIDSVGQIREIPFMYEELYRRVSPYLIANNLAEK